MLGASVIRMCRQSRAVMEVTLHDTPTDARHTCQTVQRALWQSALGKITWIVTQLVMLCGHPAVLCAKGLVRSAVVALCACHASLSGSLIAIHSVILPCNSA